jgi:hypothetical protein
VTEAEESHTEPEINRSTQPEVKLNDNKMRLIGIPFFGVAIPNLTGLFGTITIADARYWFGYLFFIGLAAAIWQGNRYLLFRTRKRFTWFDKPIEKLVLLFMNNIFYTVPLTVAWLCTWYNIAGFGIKWETILVVSLVNVICVLFVTHVYETVFMVKEQQNEQLRSSELERAKAEAELTALKNQVDPHFMFNSLNTLTHLIKTDEDKALQFTLNLAEVYRYILMQKDHVLVLLEDELQFTQKYTDLLHLRFGNSLIIHKDFNGTTVSNYLIPPTSVFVTFENAVKHNEVSEKAVMHMNLSIQDGRLRIINSVREKKNKQPSPGIGLKNLNERFVLITGKPIYSGLKANKFIVELPLTQLGNS